MSLSHDLQLEGKSLVTERTADKIRQFIKELKEDFACWDIEMQSTVCKGKNVLTILDEILLKRAGKELI